mgnify:CR=1 FL=1
MEEPKVILITGGSSGIGFDAAERLAKEGHRVYAAARRVAKMDPLVASGVTPLALDVTDESSCKACVEAVLAAEGRIDVLVNAAGYGSFGPLEAVPESEARRQMEVNLIGLSRMCSLVIPSMRERGSGRIINIASVAGRAVLYFGGWYNVSKYGVEAFSDALRMELKPFGIDVVIIEPGAIRTEWGDITADNLTSSATGTPYEDEALREAHNFRTFFQTRFPSDPSVVGEAISRAVRARKPRIRYRVGFASGVVVIGHSLLPARLWDSIGRLIARRSL